MKRWLWLVSLSVIASPVAAQEAVNIPNPLIDYPQFQAIVNESAQERERRRVTEGEFLTLMQQPDTVILDARSANRYDLLHIQGAVSLPFTEFTAETLARAIPTQDTQVLIYCNNNFLGDPLAFAAKMPAASLNLSTYTALKAYGYTNIYELGPLLDVTTTQLPLVKGNTDSPGSL